jgi:hypothetical protein
MNEKLTVIASSMREVQFGFKGTLRGAFFGPGWHVRQVLALLSFDAVALCALLVNLGEGALDRLRKQFHIKGVFHAVAAQVEHLGLNNRADVVVVGDA